MKKSKHLLNNSFRWMSAMMLMVGFCFVSLQLNAQTTASNNTAVATVDNSAITSTATLAVPAGDVISNVEVSLEITHTWVGDLSATLTSPDGTVISLFEQPGVPATGLGCDQDNIQVTLDDAAASTAADLESTCNTSFTGAGVAGAPFAISGSFQSIDALAGLNGEAAAGDYILTVLDGAGGDGGFLEGFSVTVTHAAPPPPPCVPTNVGLTCNDNIQVSVDASCIAVVGPDMVLEGNGYCYDDYTVSINGGSNVVNPSMVGGTFSVMVTQTSTGNSCWGTISVEDKIAPIVVCNDLVLACDDALPTATSTNTTAPASVTAETASGNGLAGPGTTMFFDLTNLTSSSYDVTGFDVNITANTMVNVYTITGGTFAGNEGNAGAWTLTTTADATSGAVAGAFPGDGTLTPAALAAPLTLAAGSTTAIALEYVSAGANYTNGTGANQSFTDGSLQFDGGSGGVGGFGQFFSPRIFNGAINYNLPTLPIEVSDACGIPTITHSDVVVDNGCGGIYSETITRTWTATDGSGNATSCTATYQRLRPTLADVVFPIDATIDCSKHEDDVYPANHPLAGQLRTGEPTGASCGGNISITKHDHIAEICEGSYKVLRTWKAIDWCATAPNNIIEGTQIVKVLDTKGPSITGISDINISPNGNGCLASTILPEGNITDDCSGSDIQISYTSTDGVISYDNINHVWVISDLALGSATVTLTATDACGNESTEDFDINTEDNIAPIAICDEHTIASIGSDGYVSIPALTFDDGSYDNCELVEYKVRRMTDACHFPPQLGFGDYAVFCCADIGSTVMVELRVKDAAGNTNSCMVEVEVQDKLKPTIVCPPNKTIDCDDDFLDLGLTGEAVATDNCDDVTPSYVDNVNIDNCGEGTVTRIWSVIDASGNSASCVQFITLVNSDPFIIVDTECRTYPINHIEPPVGPHSSKDDVEWPCDIELTTCGNGLSPSDLEANYPLDARPQVTEGYCDLIAVTYEDTTLPIQGDACLKILRNWIIIDWCNYDVDHPYAGGRWEYTQLIKVVNSEAPQLFPGGDSYVGNFDDDCGSTYVELFTTAADDCTPTEDIEVSYSIVNANGYVVNSGYGLNASQAFANGSYTITWTASDGCSNHYSVDHDFKVEDKKKPTPVCINGLSTVIMPSSGAVTIWANDFESGSSFDNCTPYSGLQFSFSSDITETSRTFTCADINSSNQVVVEIWVTDGNGNQDFCLTYILVQDPNGACPPTAAAAVEGVIETEDNDEVEDVTITLDGSTAAPIVTGANGAFNFPNMAGTNYVVTPSKDMNPLNGVTTFDLVLISKHILGTQALGTPYKMIAADANNSGTVTTFDIVTLRRLILQIDTEFANNNSWRFVAADYTFPNTSNPWSEVFPETVNLSTSNATDFVGVKIGDVNGSASPNSLLGTDTRTFNGDLVFNLDNKEVKAGEEFTVDFKAKDFNNMLGYQFTLAFEGAEFVDVATTLEQLGTENFGLTMLEEGVITTSWNTAAPVKMNDDAVLFSLTFQATAAANVSDILGLSSRFTTAEAYNGNADLYNVALNFNGTTVTAGGFELYQNTPNPFKAETSIGFNLPEAGNVTLKIYDVSGRVLKQVNGDFAKGYNEVNVTRDELSGTGVMYYQLDTQNESVTKKMILVD